jgi:Zn-dependent peptidase ImmA (M78 family)
MIGQFERSFADRSETSISKGSKRRPTFMTGRKQLAMKALDAALDVRRDMHVELWAPVCVYDIAHEMGVEVRFLRNSSMEGIYRKSKNPVIFVSALRPAGRQVYTCAHELGHHVFGHGSILVDEFPEISSAQNRRDPREILADMFAGFLLMPKSAVESAFAVRGWSLRTCTSIQIYTIAGWLGVGYLTLLNHMAYTLHLIPPYQIRELEKISLSTIRARYLKRETKENLIIVDSNWFGRSIDLQVGDLIQLPPDVQQEGDFVRFQENNQHGRLFCATRQGMLGRFSNLKTGWEASVRVTRKDYSGRALYRHMEDSDED